MERLFRLLGLKYPPQQIYCRVPGGAARASDEDSAAALEFLDNVLDRDMKRIIVPILDDPAMLAQRGARSLWDTDTKIPKDAIRATAGSRDEWLVACAIATAAQLGMTELVPDIQTASQGGHGDAVRRSRGMPWRY